MNRLWSLAGMTGALFVVCLGSMVVTSSPSMAQAVKPPQDVRVVNSDTQPIPVALDGTPSVNVANTPSVSVSSLPAVQISGTPTVNIGNTPTVNVANLPAVQGPEVVSVQIAVTIPNGQAAAGGTLYTVPAGKRLKINFISAKLVTDSGNEQRLEIQSLADGFFSTFLSSDSAQVWGSVRIDSIAAQIEQYAHPGREVSAVVYRSSHSATATAPNVIFMVGELHDFPSPGP